MLFCTNFGHQYILQIFENSEPHKILHSTFAFLLDCQFTGFFKTRTKIRTSHDKIITVFVLCLITGYSIHERHNLLYNSIGYLKEEAESLERVKSLLFRSFSCIVLGTILELVLFTLYNAMYHPFSGIIFPGDKNLTLEEVRSFLLLKSNCAKWRDNIHEYYFGKGDIEMNVMTANQNSTNNITDKRNLDVSIEGNKFICDKITQHCNNDENILSLLDKDESTIIAREIISTLIWSLINSDETTKCSSEESSPNLDQTEDTIEPNEEKPFSNENKVQIPNYDYKDNVDGDNDESEIKLQEIYVLTLTVIGVILFGAVFGMLLTSLGFNTQIGNVLKILNMIFSFLLLTKYAKNNIYIYTFILN